MSIKLLFADDSVTMQKVFQLTTENEDIDLRLVDNGEEAAAFVSNEKPDVVVADISIPKINGFELCRRIKESPETRGVPVILISGEMEEYDENLGKSVGADRHITKPFKSVEFIETIKKITANAVGVQEMQPVRSAGSADAAGPTAASDAMLELSPVNSAKDGEPDDAAAYADEELEIVDDDLNVDDGLGDEDEVGVITDGMGIEGVGMEFPSEDDEAALETDFAEESFTHTQSDQPVKDGLAESAGAGDDVGKAVLDDELSETLEELDDISKTEDTYEAVTEPGEDQSMEVPAVEEHAEVAGLDGDVDGADKILAEVFDENENENENETDAPADETLLGEESESESAEPPSEVVVEDEIASMGTSGFSHTSEPVVDKTEKSRETKGMDELFRASIEQTVRDFLEKDASGILKEVLAESVDRHITAVFKSHLETVIREEISVAIGKSFQTSMPKLLDMIEKITSQITPRIAEEMIKTAIEQIQKGDIN
ncbi:MAG: hypothetical protein IEMM0002_1415 [bacterium]|nr:MAG: hypothetical protein IEMM0002_1415 [bacterium]